MNILREQGSLFPPAQFPSEAAGAAFKTQLLKWIGNKQRQAPDIISYFPADYGRYFEPFLGSGGVMGVLAPPKGVASDIFPPLVEIWKTLHDDAELLKNWYSDRLALVAEIGKKEAYNRVLASYNAKPNGADLVFLCRACYGGVVRFRKADGFMSTPCGVHTPIAADSFASRVEAWQTRTRGMRFECADFADTMRDAKPGDLVYCDPPYSDTQTILYGAQSFSLERLLAAIEDCKSRGVKVALSIDGTKFSGTKLCDVPVPAHLFAREAFVNVGRSMLKRFQMDGKTLESHEVTDRLLLTY